MALHQRGLGQQYGATVTNSSDARNRVVVYVDGFNLYHGMKHQYNRRFFWLDLHALAASMLLSNQRLTGVHYFTALVRNDPDGGARQQTYLDALESLPLLQVHIGRFQEKTLYCSGCRRTRTTYEEKETDVAIAVQLVGDAARGRMDTAILVSGDSDLVPAIQEARRLREGLRIVAAFPPRRTSADVKAHVDANFVIRRTKLRDAQLPDVLTVGGQTLRRPKHWT